MSDIFKDVEAALGRLSAAIASSLSQDNDLLDIWGWNAPVLNKYQVAERADDLVVRIKRIPKEKRTDKAYIEWLENVPGKVDKFIVSTLPQIANGNAALVVNLLEQLCVYIEGRLPPETWPIDWEAAAEAGQLPTKLARRLRSIEAGLAKLEPRTGDLDAKIARIEDAHSSAESLPTDLASLEEGRNQVAAIAIELARLAEQSRTANDDVGKYLGSIKDQSDEAVKLMANIDSSYRATTSKALADAFAKRSFWLQVQTWVFVCLLIGALGIGGYLGFRRVSALEEILKSERTVSTALLWINLAVSFLSVAAPVWFAWIATKQISQRFKLAEDYGFKAAVAKAYEGYRREAASVDPLFVTRLFGSALARLEEAPLRLVDEENYGSPFHELTASAGFRQALGVFPALREKYESVLNSMKAKTPSGAAEVPSTATGATED